MANKPIDTKREEFRKYLESAGVMDALTKVLVSLYEEPEKPEAALDYVITHLGGSPISTEDLEKLQNDLKEAQDKVAELEKENASLKEKEGGAPGEGEEGAPPPEGEADAGADAPPADAPADAPPADAPADAPPA